ncbi:MAG: hypothetical protein EOP89_00165 [Lysobacteraceae bacterium]|nr:MAG: hypothetical protein EOP89_00165 [Xanthomonadaceae bacterium]
MNIHQSGGIVVPITSCSQNICEEGIASLVADHRRLKNLCDLLEHCADELPVMPTAFVVQQICDALTGLIDKDVPESSPYPDVADLYDPSDPLALVLMEEVHARHTADALHAQDLVDALRGTPEIAHRLSPDTIGYMLRCFFEGCRQAMDCEELAILALARNRLTQGTRRLLMDSLRLRSRRRRPAVA